MSLLLKRTLPPTLKKGMSRRCCSRRTVGIEIFNNPATSAMVSSSIAGSKSADISFKEQYRSRQMQLPTDNTTLPSSRPLNYAYRQASSIAMDAIARRGDLPNPAKSIIGGLARGSSPACNHVNHWSRKNRKLVERKIELKKWCK